MDDKTKELIAIGASVGAHCQPCLVYHLGRARELGISEEMIRDAIEIGFMVEKGAGNAMRKQTAEIAKQPQTRNEPCCPGGDSTCCSNGGAHTAGPQVGACEASERLEEAAHAQCDGHTR